MKHLFLVIAITVLSCTCAAQDTVLVPSVRVGNRYMIGSEMMNKKAYRGYLQNTCPEAFTQFDKGYKTAIAGWGLMGAGPVAFTAGFWIFFPASFGWFPDMTPEQERHLKGVVGSGMALTCLGGAALLSSIVCVSVGYSQMHQASNKYNNRCATHTTYWTIQGQGNQLNLALHF